MQEKLINININFDSLFWPLSIDRKEQKDPSFFKIADRIFEISSEYGFKHTIFIVGKDLINPEVAARVKEWSSAGHEICNHSYTHDPNLGSLPIDRMKEEVVKSHELISNVIGKEPKGFLSPSWSTSNELVSILIEMGYVYDTSLFPSYFQFLVLLKLMLLRKKGHKHFNPNFKDRKDKLAFFLAPRKPYFVGTKSLIRKENDGLLMLPLPVSKFLRIPCWHSIYFPFGKVASDFILKRALKEHDNFYYVIHPRDLLDYENDLSKDFKEKYADELTAFEALNFPFDKKVEYIKSAFQIIKESGGKPVTLEEMATRIINEKKKSNDCDGDKA